INGPRIKDVIQRFTDLTGKTVMPPLNSLGYQGSTMYYSELPENCDIEINSFVETCKKFEIPVDLFNLSSGYTATGDCNNRNVFTWNKKRFPEPEKWINLLKSVGIHIVPNVKPGILLSHPLYQEFASAGSFVRDGEK